MSKLSSRGVDTERAARIDIINPYTGEPLLGAHAGAFVMVLSGDSRAAEKARDASADKRINRLARGQERMTQEQAREEDIDMAVSLTVGPWCLIDPDTLDIIDEPFSESAARELYSLPGWRWLRDQVLRGAGTRGNFRRMPPPS